MAVADLDAVIADFFKTFDVRKKLVGDGGGPSEEIEAEFRQGS